MARPTDAHEAVALLRTNAAQVIMSVGTDPDDPVCHIYYDPDEEPDCRIVTTSVAGWSAGVREPVCSAESGFLEGFLSEKGTETLVLIEEPYAPPYDWF
jgi:hypothetical protein